MLEALGFRTLEGIVETSHFVEFSGIDGHGRAIGTHANWVESGVVEGVKWLGQADSGQRTYPTLPGS